MRSLIFVSLLAFLAATVSGLSCPSGELPCDDGEQCISSSNWCNEDEKQCLDGSDELYCSKRGYFRSNPNNCKDSHFLCEDGRCVPKSAECNGYLDCKDGSDEDNCEKSEEKKNASEEDYSSWEDYTTKPVEEDTSAGFNNNDNDDETSKLITPGTTPSTPEVTPRFLLGLDKPSWTPIAENRYYISKLNGATTTAPRTYSPTRPSSLPSSAPASNVRGNYYPPPPPTFPKQTTNNRRTRPTQPTTNYENAPSYHSILPANPTPNSRRQPERYPTTDHRQPAIHPTDVHSPIPLILSPTSRYPPDDRRQPTYSQPGGWTPQQTYHLPPRQPPLKEFHENVIPPYPFGSGDRGVVSPRTVPSYTGRRKVLPRFNFLRDFSTASNDESVKRAVEWILRRREPSRGWGTNTPRALVALSLVNNSFVGGLRDNDSLKTYLKLHVGLKLLNPRDIRLTELAHIVLGLLATCQDPSDFQGMDLGRTLLEKDKNRHPFTLLTACLAGQPLLREHLDALFNYTAASTDTEKNKDRLILSLSALSCYVLSNPAESHRLSQRLPYVTSKLLQLRLDDGSFGSVYSTAIAAQALMSLNHTLNWNPAPTFRFLRERQDINGSFGDFLSTYYVIPALKGRSLLHLRNTRCTPKDEELSPQEILDFQGEMQYLEYSLHFGLPLSNAYSVRMRVPLGINFFDVMRVAEYLNKHFTFQHDIRNEKINVYSISDIPNDPERGLAWNLYVRDGHNFQKLNKDEVKHLIPRPNDQYFFWYHHVGLTPQL